MHRIATCIAIALVVAVVAAAQGGIDEAKCPEEEYLRLRKQVLDACRGVHMRCLSEHECPELIARWKLQATCGAARQILMDTCFPGGNAGHRKAIEQAEQGQKTCLRFITKKSCDTSDLKINILVPVVPCEKPCREPREGAEAPNRGGLEQPAVPRG
jgi:hypothetical protein